MSPQDALALSCSQDNDLCRALVAGGNKVRRFDSPARAVAAAPRGGAVLILADGYPNRTTRVPATLLATAARKRLRLYVEFAGGLPGLRGGKVRTTQWERAVVASRLFGHALRPKRILAIHDCHFVPMKAKRPDLVVARVAGFDSAVYGLPAKDVYPILFKHPKRDILIATTKLSQFITARYAPSEAWDVIWRRILGWLCGSKAMPRLKWAPTVRPTYTATAKLSAEAEREAFRRGADWFLNARLFMHRSWKKVYDEAGKYYDRVGPPPQSGWPCGDGTEGMLEGFNAGIRVDGSQRFRWYLRNDCMGEGTLAMALSGVIDGRARRRRIAANLADFTCFHAPTVQGARRDPKHPSYGLMGWSMPGAEHIYYGDDNARSLLGLIGTAALLKSGRWDERILRCLVANLRTSDRLGFRPGALTDKSLEEHGWRHYFNAAEPNYHPHYEAYLWACLLWAYKHTGYRPFLDRAKTAIRMTMAVYPEHWHWTNGIQQERARMLLPLAWLVRVEDTPEHRGWLKRMARELLAHQDPCGAIREEIGSAGKGACGPPKTNEKYGTAEAPLIQANGDPLCDLLYTTNFAFLGLHEAAAATGEAFYKRACDKLARFLCRIQVRSRAHPELDGAWFRAFEFGRWDYWASNADLGWGAWSIESGWTQAWIVSVLAMREMRTSLWDLTARSRIGRHMRKLLPEMIPPE